MPKKKLLSYAVAVLVAAGLIGLVLFGIPDAPVDRNLVVQGEETGNSTSMRDFSRDSGQSVDYVLDTGPVALQKANQDLSSASGLYDIILQYNFALAPFVRNDWVYNLSETKQLLQGKEVDFAFESDLFENVWKEVGYFQNPDDPAGNPIPIAYPFAASTMVLTYNRAMFDNAANQEKYRAEYGEPLAPPKTWDQLFQIAEFFTEHTDLKGIVLSGATGGWLYYDWCNYAFGLGGGVMDKQFGWQSSADTPLLIDSAATVDATKFWLSLKPFNAGDFFSTGILEKREILLQEKAPMGIMWSGLIPGMIEAKPNTFGFSPIPGGKSPISGGSFFLSKSSELSAESAAYVAWLLQPPHQKEMIRMGLISPLKSAYDAEVLKEIPYLQAIVDSLDQGVYMHEAGPDAEVINQTLTKYLQMIWRGDMSAEAGLSEAQREIADKRAKLF